jgi:hypothetical protein
MRDEWSGGYEVELVRTYVQNNCNLVNYSTSKDCRRRLTTGSFADGLKPAGLKILMVKQSSDMVEGSASFPSSDIYTVYTKIILPLVERTPSRSPRH